MPSACLECGLPLNAGDAFCGNCGRPAGTRIRDDSPPISAGSTARHSWPGYEPAAPGEPRGEPAPPGASFTTQQPPFHAHQPRPGSYQAAGSPFPDGAARMRTEHRPAAPPGNGVAAAGTPREIIRIDANADQRLSYTETSNEPTFDPLRNSRFGWQLVRRFALFLGVAAVVSFLLFLFFGLIFIVTRDESVFEVSGVLGTLVELGLLVAYVVMPVPALLTQWSRLLNFQADAADIAFAHIAQAVDRHGTPSDSFQPRTLLPPGEGIRTYLELRRGVFSGFISCFAHGRDLYVGWSFWIYMSPLRWVMMRIGRYVQDRTGRGNDMHQTLRYESTRATVAAMHACTLEGIDAAIRSLDPEGGGLLDTDVPFAAS